MFFKSATKPTTAELLALIEEAKNAELCRDNPLSQQILRRIWTDFSEDPGFDYCEPIIKAELLRISGVFLSFYGKYVNQKNFQIRGKNLLTNAIDIFENENLTDKAAEAKVMLALCYWNEGEVNECESYLETVENEFSENQLHPVFLQIKVNQLMTLFYRNDMQSAQNIIEDIKIRFEFCKDYRLKAMYHNQAGIVYNVLKKFDEADFHLHEAIRYAKRVNNSLFVALNLNNLCFLYKETKQFSLAHKVVDQSIKILSENYIGMLPHAFDSKALTYLDENKLDEALNFAEQAVSLFSEGEDYSGLTDAMWTKCRCLLRLDRKFEAYKLYSEIQSIAAERIGAVACDKFAQELANDTYVPKNLPLLEEVRQFKKFLVKAGIVKLGNNVVDLAKYLGIDKHQTLSNIINNQFPELYDELGIKRRRSPTLNAPKKAKTKTKKLEAQTNVPAADPIETPEETHYHDRSISPVHIDTNIARFDFPMLAKDFVTFYFDAPLMTRLGIEAESIVAVVPVRRIEKDLTILASDGDSYYLGEVQADDTFEFLYLLKNSREPIILDSSNVIGVPVGYCPLSEADGEIITFSELEVSG